MFPAARLDPGSDASTLPPLAATHGGRRESLVMLLPANGDERRWVLRLWRSDVLLQPGHSEVLPGETDVRTRIAGDIDLNISGCMNACGHHHVGHIGILGVDKKGQEFYQVSLGGSSGREASLAQIDNLEDYLEDIERKLIMQALEETRWNRTAAAQRLGLTFRSMRYRLKKLGID